MVTACGSDAAPPRAVIADVGTVVVGTVAELDIAAPGAVGPIESDAAAWSGEVLENDRVRLRFGPDVPGVLPAQLTVATVDGTLRIQAAGTGRAPVVQCFPTR